VPAAAARLSRPEDPRSVAEALYEESLGDEQTRVGAEVSRVCYTFCGESALMLRRSWSGSGTATACFKYGALIT